MRGSVYLLALCASLIMSVSATLSACTPITFYKLDESVDFSRYQSVFVILNYSEELADGRIEHWPASSANQYLSHLERGLRERSAFKEVTDALKSADAILEVNMLKEYGVKSVDEDTGEEYFSFILDITLTTPAGDLIEEVPLGGGETYRILDQIIYHYTRYVI